MTLYDEIIDKAEEIAEARILPPHANCEEIAATVSAHLGLRVPLHPNSNFARLAEAAYNRYSFTQLAS